MDLLKVILVGSLVAVAFAQDGCKAPATFTAENGSFSSPYYDFSHLEYPANLRCRYTINVPAGQNISLAFDDPFETEGTYLSSCVYDYVNIYDAAREEYPICAGAQLLGANFTRLAGPFCGRGVVFLPFVVQGPSIVVEFCTDVSSHGQGFRLHFNATSEPIRPVETTSPALPTGGPGPAGPCEESFTLDLQTPNASVVYIESPNYPGNYHRNARCTWTVILPAGSTWQVTAEDFYTEATHDYVSLFDGTGTGAAVGTFSGQNGPNRVRGSSNVLTATFRSDSSIEYTGFRLRVSVSRCSGEYSACPNDPSGDECAFHPSMFCDGKPDCPGGVDENCGGGCGTPHTKPYISSSDIRIVGGIEVKPHSWPWQIAMLNNGGLRCGGSVIDHFFVLTAAHCCSGMTAANTQVLVGDHSLSGRREPNSVTYNVKRIINHPRFGQRPVLTWDFCLLETQSPIFFNNDVSAVCLPSGRDMPVGERCWITGWGETSQRNQSRANTFPDPAAKTEAVKQTKASSDTLRQVDVKIISQEECNADYGGVITRDQICAENTGDSCQGDSGGPMVCRSQDDPNRFELHGVVSWAYGCADPRYPGSNGRVSEAMDWIAGTLMDQRMSRGFLDKK